MRLFDTRSYALTPALSVLLTAAVMSGCDGVPGGIGATDACTAQQDASDGTLTFDIEDAAFESCITTAQRVVDGSILINGTELLSDDLGIPTGERVVNLSMPSMTGSFPLEQGGNLFTYIASEDGDTVEAYSSDEDPASGTVTVEEVDETHVKGTFSGTFYDDDQTASGVVSAGAFDVEISE